MLRITLGRESDRLFLQNHRTIFFTSHVSITFQYRHPLTTPCCRYSQRSWPYPRAVSSSFMLICAANEGSANLKRTFRGKRLSSLELLGVGHNITLKWRHFSDIVSAITSNSTIYIQANNKQTIRKNVQWHYNDVIMSAMASQITSFAIVYSNVYSGTDQRKHQSSAPLSFVRKIHLEPVNSPHKGPVTRKMFPLDDVIMDTEGISMSWCYREHIWY